MVTGDKNQKFSSDLLFAIFLDRLAGDAKPGDLNFIKRANNFNFIKVSQSKQVKVGLYSIMREVFR